MCLATTARVCKAHRISRSHPFQLRILFSIQATYAVAKSFQPISNMMLVGGCNVLQKLEKWTTEKWTDDFGPGFAHDKRKKYLETFWLLSGNDDPMWRCRNPHRTKEGFSYTMVIMDKGWRLVGRRTRSRRKYYWRYRLSLDSLKCGETPLAAFGQDKKRRLIEDMNRICVRVDDDHVWVSEIYLVQEEHRTWGLLQYDIEVPCVWHWGCGFSAFSNMNESFRKDGRLTEKVDRAIGTALEAAVEYAFLDHERLLFGYTS